MKKILIIVCVLAVNAMQAQLLSPTVIATAGDYSTDPGVSLSWTLGEIATETFSSVGNKPSQGIQKPVSEVIITAINLDLLVFIKGPNTGTEMAASLNAAGQLPLGQPYNSTTWKYTGTEPVPSISIASIERMIYFKHNTYQMI